MPERITLCAQMRDKADYRAGYEFTEEEAEGIDKQVELPGQARQLTAEPSNAPVLKLVIQPNRMGSIPILHISDYSPNIHKNKKGHTA